MTHSPDSSRGDDGFPVIRTIALVIVALAMIWLALTVRLPDMEALRGRIDDFGFWSWAVFILVYAGVALTPIPVTIMALAGGLLFGVVAGSVLAVIGAMLGSLAGYAIARGLGKETVLRLLGKRGETLEQRLEDAGFKAVFTLRVLPGMPYWPINYAAGALGVRFQVFTIASLIASVPGQVSLVAIGAFLGNPTVLNGAVVVVAWVVVIVMTIWAWRAWRGTASIPLPGSTDDDGDGDNGSNSDIDSDDADSTGSAEAARTADADEERPRVSERTGTTD